MTTPAGAFQLPDPILVVGGYGYRNVGDEAILASLLRALDGRRVTVVSRAPAETMAVHGVRAIPPTAALEALRSHQSVLIGGGGLFGADMGSLGRLLPAYGLAALGLGREVAIHGVGIDRRMPLGTAAALRQLARRASEVSVRDASSAEVLREWGVDAAVGPDLASWLPPARATFGAALLRSAGLDPRRPIVGLALTAVNPDLAEPALEAAEHCLESLPDVQFGFIPMSQHPFVARHNDLLLARRLQARQPRLRIVEGAPHPAHVLAAFGHLAVAVCMRYHGLVFAARAGVPIVPVAYADKCRTWLAERGEAAVEPDGPTWVTHIRRALDGSAAARARRAAS